MEDLTADDLVLLELLRKCGAMRGAEFEAAGLARGTVESRLARLASIGLVEMWVELYLINDDGIAALKAAFAARARELENRSDR